MIKHLFIVILFMPLSLYAEISKEEAKDLEKNMMELEQSIDKITKKTKSTCYIAIPNHDLCMCLNKHLGWAITIQHYVIIRTLPTYKEKINFIKSSFSAFPDMTDEQSVKIIDQTNEAWSQCQDTSQSYN